MQNDLPPVRGDSVFENINILPRSQSHPPLNDGDGNLRLGQRRANMRRHVVWSFRLVPVGRVPVGHQTAEEIVEIGKNVRVCVFLNHQRGRCESE